MEKLPAEILLHIFKLGKFELPDYKNLRLVGNKQLTAFLTPQVFETLTVTLTENGLKRLGRMLGLAEDDALFLRAAEQLYMQDPIDRPDDQDWDEMICSRIESILQGEIPSMVRKLHIRSIPKFEVLSKDEFSNRLLPPETSWGGNMNELWEQYSSIMEKQGKNDGKLKYGGYGLAALMIALAGAVPKLESVSLHSEIPSELEKVSKKLLKEVNYGCETTVQQGWAIMFHGLAQRRWMMQWQQERNKELFGDEYQGILPITMFHLGDMFPGWRARYKNLEEDTSTFVSKRALRAIQREPQLYLLGSGIRRPQPPREPDDEPESRSLNENEDGLEFNEDLKIKFADPPEQHLLRWDGLESFNTLHLEILTVFSVRLCPYHYNAGEDAKVMFCYGRWSLTKEYDVEDGKNEVPEIVPWSVVLHSMRNLKHLNLSASIPSDGPKQLCGSDRLHHAFGSQILHPVASNATPGDIRADGYLQCQWSSMLFSQGAFEDARDDNIFFKLNYPDLDVDIKPGERVNGVKHGKHWQNLIDADWATLEGSIVRCTSSSWLAKSSGFWPYLETFSLSGFNVHVAYLQVLLHTNKHTLKHILLDNIFFFGPDHCNFNRISEHYRIENFPVLSNPELYEVVDNEEYKSLVLSIWEYQILEPAKYDTLMSTIVHIASVPNLQRVSFNECTWIEGYPLFQHQLALYTKKVDNFWYLLLDELLQKREEGQMEKLGEEVMDMLYKVYFKRRWPELPELPEFGSHPDVVRAMERLDSIREKFHEDREAIMKIFQSSGRETS